MIQLSKRFLMTAVDQLLRRTWAVHAWPVCPQVSKHVWLSASGRELPMMTALSGTQRARDLLIRRSVRVVLLVRQRPYPQLRACRVASWSGSVQRCPHGL